MKTQALAHMARKLGSGEDSSLVFDRWLTDTSDTLIQHLAESKLPTVVQKLSVSDIVEMAIGYVSINFCSLFGI